MTVNSSEDIIRRAREMEMMRKLKGNEKTAPDQNMIKMIQILEMKMDMINRKLDELIQKRVPGEFKDVHMKILEMLGEWMSTQNISSKLGYSQEYVSRKVAELKEMEKIVEKREGKNLFYRKVA